MDRRFTKEDSYRMYVLKNLFSIFLIYVLNRLMLTGNIQQFPLWIVLPRITLIQVIVFCICIMYINIVQYEVGGCDKYRILICVYQEPSYRDRC